jgi:hypothetical protein
MRLKQYMRIISRSISCNAIGMTSLVTTGFNPEGESEQLRWKCRRYDWKNLAYLTIPV